MYYLHIISMAFFLVFFPTWNNNNYQRLFPFCFIIADERIGLAFLIKSYFSLEVEGAFEGARTWPFSCCNLVKKGRLLMRQRTKCVTFYGAVTWDFFLPFFATAEAMLLGMTTDTGSVCQTWFLETYCTNTSNKFRQIGYENKLPI